MASGKEEEISIKEQPKAVRKGKAYKPRADYAWVPAVVTVAFVFSFILMIFIPSYVEAPEKVIEWFSEIKSDVILFVGLCLGFFLKTTPDK